MPYFNSIKVQLELNVQQCARHKILFQFHKGTIRTKENRGSMQLSYISIP